MNRLKFQCLVIIALLSSAFAKGQITLKTMFYYPTGMEKFHYNRAIVPELLWMVQKDRARYRRRIGCSYVPLKTRLDTFPAVTGYEIYTNTHYILLNAGLDYIIHPKKKKISIRG